MVQSLRREDQILYLLTHQVLTPARHERLVSLVSGAVPDWEYIAALAVNHRVAPLFSHHLSQADLAKYVPLQVLSRFKYAAMQNIITKKGSRMVLHAVAARLQALKVQVMLVKGAAYNLLIYQQDWLVEQADIDLLLRPQKDDLPPQTLQDVLALLDGLNDQRAAFSESLEYDFYTHHDVSMNGVVPVNFERIWQDARTVDLRGAPVLVMAPEDMLIAAAVNACRKRYFRLRSLLDISEIIQAFPDLDWNLLNDKARQYSTGSLVFCALRATACTLGLELPAGTWENLPVSSLQRRMITGVMDSLVSRYDLRQLNQMGSGVLFGRRLNRLLLLTYCGYSPSMIGRKLLLLASGKDRPPKPRPKRAAMPSVNP